MEPATTAVPAGVHQGQSSGFSLSAPRDGAFRAVVTETVRQLTRVGLLAPVDAVVAVRPLAVGGRHESRAEYQAHQHQLCELPHVQSFPRENWYRATSRILKSFIATPGVARIGW